MKPLLATFRIKIDLEPFSFLSILAEDSKKNGCSTSLADEDLRIKSGPFRAYQWSVYYGIDAIFISILPEKNVQFTLRFYSVLFAVFISSLFVGLSVLAISPHSSLTQILLTSIAYAGFFSCIGYVVQGIYLFAFKKRIRRLADTHSGDVPRSP